MPKFLISDCDYTLIDFNHEGGITALRDHSDYSFLADIFNNYFQTILQGTRISDKVDLSALHLEFKNMSDTLVKGDEKLYDCIWSRELWAYAHLTDLSPSDRVKTALLAANTYWEGVGKSSAIYEDAVSFIETLRQNKFQVILVSSSDGRLSLDKETDNLVYIPKESKRLKAERYKLCGLDKYVDLENELFIGDPVAKPHKIFWEDTLRELSIDLSKNDNHIVVIGDSYDTDLTGATWFKSQTILLDRKHKHTGVTELPAADHVAHNLKEALQFIL